MSGTGATPPGTLTPGRFDTEFDPCPYGAEPVGLREIVGISLFSDGFWADFDLEPSHPFGSRLGELARSPANQTTADAMATAARDALDWMINERLADRVEASAIYTPPEQIDLTVTIHRGEQTESYTWADLWSQYV